MEFSAATGSDVVVIVSGDACTVRPVLPVMLLSVAVIVLLPAPTAVARPVLLMVAVEIFDEVQETWPEMSWVVVSE
jgi:hypothetical protein